VDFEKFCHGTPLTEINNAVDNGPSTTVFVAPWTVYAIVLLYTIRFDLSLYLLQTGLYNI